MSKSRPPKGDGKGLGPRRRRAVAKRPARPSARAGSAVPPPLHEYAEKVEISRHRDLVGHQREIFQRLNDNPQLAVLMAINPVLALNELGVHFNTEMRDHVLRALRHPPPLNARRLELEAELEAVLGETLQPNNPKWLAGALFEKLRVEPLVTDGHAPAYKPPVNAATIERLRRRRPGKTWKASEPPAVRTKRLGRIVLKEWQPAVRRMDLDAPLPRLCPADRAPAELGLEELYFYKESHPLARSLLELGIIQQRSFPVHTGASYREIRNGDKANAFRAWIREIRFGRT